MTTAERLYKDIIDKSRPDNPQIRQKHPRMQLADRAKIFAPFSALRGLEDVLDETKAEHETGSCEKEGSW